MPVTLAVLNDYPLVVAGLRSVLDSYPDRVRVAELDTGTSVAARVDVVLHDTYASTPGTVPAAGGTVGPGAPKRVIYSFILTGTHPLSLPEMASIIGDELGRTIRYLHLPWPAMYGVLRLSGLPHWQANGLVHQFVDVVRRGADYGRVHTFDLQELLGREPRGIADLVHAHRPQRQGRHERGHCETGQDFGVPCVADRGSRAGAQCLLSTRSVPAVAHGCPEVESDTKEDQQSPDRIRRHGDTLRASKLPQGRAGHRPAGGAPDPRPQPGQQGRAGDVVRHLALVMAFNLTRAAATLTGPGLAQPTTATIRRKLISVPARIASSARRITLHLPTAWPWEQAWTDLFIRVCGPPPGQHQPGGVRGELR